MIRFVRASVKDTKQQVIQTSGQFSLQLDAFKGKLKLKKNLLLNDEAASFVDIQNAIVEHFAKLIVECDHYIPGYGNSSKSTWKIRVESSRILHLFSHRHVSLVFCETNTLNPTLVWCSVRLTL